MKVKNYSDMMMYLTRPDIMPEDSERVGFKTAGLVKKLLSQIPVRTGIERTQKIKDLTPQKEFRNAFLEYAQKKFDGNFKAAAESIGESREKIKGIFDRIRLAETGTRAGGAGIGKGARVETTIPEPKKKILYTDATTKVKADKTFLKDKIKNYDKNKFYTARDLGNILGFDFANFFSGPLSCFFIPAPGGIFCNNCFTKPAVLKPTLSKSSGIISERVRYAIISLFSLFFITLLIDQQVHQI